MRSLDPRIKLIGFLLLSIFVFTTKSLLKIGVVGGLLFFIAVIGKISPITLLKKTRFLLFIMPFAFLLHPFFTQEGSFYKGLLITLRLFIMIIGASLLNLTTQPSRLLEALKWFFSPFRFVGLPVERLSLILVMAMRLVSTIGERVKGLMKERPTDVVSSLIKEGLKEIDGFSNHKEYQA
jgi:energy-coupling factor transport system permease protein